MTDLDLKKLEELERLVIEAIGTRALGGSGQVAQDWNRALTSAQDAVLEALARRDGVSEPVGWFRQSRMNPETWSQVGADEAGEFTRLGYVVRPLFAHPAPASAPGDGEIRDAVHAWIREDVGLNVKMTLFPDVVAKLVDRLAALRQPDTAGEPKRTMTLTLTDREMAALEEVMAAKDLSAPAVFRNSFRLYQMVEKGGATVTVHEAGPFGLPTKIGRQPDPFAAEDACMASGSGEPEIGDGFHFFRSRADAGYAHATLVWKDDKGYPYSRDDGKRMWAERSTDHDFLIVERALRTPADPRPDPRDEALEWLSGQTNLELSYDHGFGDDGDEPGWVVHRVTGPMNDREWEEIARAPTVAAAIQKARETLTRMEKNDDH